MYFDEQKRFDNSPKEPLSQTLLSTNMSLYHIPEHRVYTYDDSESPRGPSSQSHPSSPSAVGLLAEQPQRPNQSNKEEATAGDAGDQLEEQQRLSRCLSDPGPSKEEGKDDFSPS